MSATSSHNTMEKARALDFVALASIFRGRFDAISNP